jgi:hypothetical protein
MLTRMVLEHKFDEKKTFYENVSVQNKIMQWTQIILNKKTVPIMQGTN